MKKSGILLLLLVVLNGFAHDRLLTLNEAVELGCRNNVELNILYSHLKQKENLWHSGLGIYPLNVSYFKEGISANNGIPCVEQRFTISQEFDFPLTTVYRLNALSKSAKVEQCQFLAKKEEVKADIKNKYIEVLYCIKNKQSKEKQYKLIRQLNKTANEIDQLRMELFSEKIYNDFRQSQKLLKKATGELYKEIGLLQSHQHDTIILTDTLNFENILFLKDKGAIGYRTHPLYQASKYESEASHYSLKETKSRAFPSFNLSLYTQKLGTSYDYYGYEIGLSIPFFFKHKGEVNSAKIRNSEIKRNQIEVQLKIEEQIEDAWQGYSECCTAIERYNKRIRNKVSGLHTNMLQAFQHGKTDFSNYMYSFQLLSEHEQQYNNTLRNLYRHVIILEKFIEQELIF
jgi:cobalt-zinc-cadmium efflux system outer membrane protein